MARERRRREPSGAVDSDGNGVTLRPPGDTPGAAVTVRFAGEEYQRVARAAQRAGVQTTQFVHAAALERAADAEPLTSPASRREAAIPEVVLRRGGSVVEQTAGAIRGWQPAPSAQELRQIAAAAIAQGALDRLGE